MTQNVYVPQNEAIQRALAAAYQAQAAAQKAREGGGFNRLRVEFPGPDGSPKSFRTASPGYRSTVYLFALPPYPGQYDEPFVEEVTHFWKSTRAPTGASVMCLGANCPVCVSRKALFRYGTEQATATANKWGKKGTKFLSQWVNLSIPAANHVNAQQQVIPATWQAPGSVRTAILEKMSLKGPSMILDPHAGRPLAVTKKRTGTGDMDVEYSVDDVEGASLHQWYHGVYSNLHDLRTWVANPDSYEDYVRALQEMGFPTGEQDQATGQALLYVWQTQQQQQQQQQLQAQQQRPQLPAAQQQQQTVNMRYVNGQWVF